jgi:hypothetical protein
MFMGYESVLNEKIPKPARRVTNDLGMSQTGEGSDWQSASAPHLSERPSRIQPGGSLRKFPPRTPVSFRFPSRPNLGGSPLFR